MAAHPQDNCPPRHSCGAGTSSADRRVICTAAAFYDHTGASVQAPVSASGRDEAIPPGGSGRSRTYPVLRFAVELIAFTAFAVAILIMGLAA